MTATAWNTLSNYDLPTANLYRNDGSDLYVCGYKFVSAGGAFAGTERLGTVSVKRKASSFGVVLFLFRGGLLLLIQMLYAVGIDSRREAYGRLAED